MFNAVKQFFLKESAPAKAEANIIYLNEKNFFDAIRGRSLIEVLDVINNTDGLSDETKEKALELGKNVTLNEMTSGTQDEAAPFALKLVKKPSKNRKKVFKQPIDTATPDMFNEYAA